MKNILFRLSAIVTFTLVVTLSAYAQQEDQLSKVIVGTYVSAQGGKIKIEGQDGNIYLLDHETVESSVIIRDGLNQVYVMSSDGLKELNVGSTVVVNVKGIVLVDVKESSKNM